MSSQHPPAIAQARAEERFKLKEQRAADARQVIDEVTAAGVAERIKTARLRELRLAREQAEQAAAAAAPPSRTKARAPAKARKARS